ncbi:sterol desaturase family protein [Paraliomyxa miuraensis]|uniref:sterol desaturase family protein n=1 Tax=Paraliomyxa miuraensis TaxID=376150 RepID=UPI00224FEB35|nr:sterol desaturase family protein [Paraliomyxa miuraensis]MCX4240332.1 sterol desaturase family protein [Paraliomyxa miuraensis]
MNLIASSIPAFFILIGVELWVARRRGRRVTRFNDAITDLGCGISSQVVGLLFVAAKLLVYAWVFEHLRLLTLPEDSGWTLVFAIVALDFIYYWWHRLSHEVNVLWAAHVVHHQSEDYNLAVALRQAWFTGITILPFYLPLAVLGVPPVPYAIANGIVTLYQFWIHTELIGKLGPLEHVLNTPSHHRVHHAINPGYLDRNYGGIFIVWDRLFGSFAPEHEVPIYGITKPLRSLNPVWANVHHWVEIGARMRAATSWRDRLWAPLAPPAWVPAGAPPAATPEPSVAREKYDPPVSWPMKAYVGLQLVTTALGTVLVLFGYRDWSGAQLLVAVTLLVAATLAAGGLMERKRWAWPLEVSRLVLSAVAALVLWP